MQQLRMLLRRILFLNKSNHYRINVPNEFDSLVGNKNYEKTKSHVNFHTHCELKGERCVTF